MIAPFTFTPGEGPLLISVPHTGLYVPISLMENYTPVGLSGKDADHCVDLLYGFSDAAKLVATYSRYVLDLNRSPDDVDLYPGQFTTGLFPTVSFDQEAVYKGGMEPDDAEKARRIQNVHKPYHETLTGILAEKKAGHGRALLWDAHSIKSKVPALFDGKLPDFNFGTNGGQTCRLPIEEAFTKVMADFPEYTYVFNGRFKGGWTTRHYGRPAEGIHAVQLELSKATYMNEDTLEFDEKKAGQIRKVLARLLETYVGLEEL